MRSGDQPSQGGCSCWNCSAVQFLFIPRTTSPGKMKAGNTWPGWSTAYEMGMRV